MLSLKNPAPVIFGCSGYFLKPEEKDFFNTHQPLGFILFKRNVQNKDQLTSLIEDLKNTVARQNPPILIDQEGGRVARLTSPHWKEHPPVRVNLEEESLEHAKTRIHKIYTHIAKDLKKVGITTNCAPVLDLDIAGADAIMGDRTFNKDPYIASILGTVAIQALLKGGVTPVMKHIPGHGAATCDSHKALPVITLSLKELEPHFAPFKANATCPWAMTAHIVYSALDPDHPATQSSFIIREIIRKMIGFKGFLVSDDIGMHALSGSFADRTSKSLAAGCDAVLHCSGLLDEMADVMKGV